MITRLGEALICPHCLTKWDSPNYNDNAISAAGHRCQQSIDDVSESVRVKMACMYCGEKWEGGKEAVRLLSMAHKCTGFLKPLTLIHQKSINRSEIRRLKDNNAILIGKNAILKIEIQKLRRKQQALELVVLGFMEEKR